MTGSDPPRTERLILRNFLAKDVSSFLAYRNDPEVARSQGWHSLSAEEAQAFASNLASRAGGSDNEGSLATQVMAGRTMTSLPGKVLAMDPTQVTRDVNGTMRCNQCGFSYELSLPAVAEQTGVGLDELTAALATVPLEDRNRRPAAGVWSVNAYVAHLAQASTVVYGRVRRIAETDRPELLNHDQDRAVEEARADELPATESLEQLRRTVQEFRAYVRGLAPQSASREGVHSLAGPVRLSDIAHDLPHELRHHALDIRTVAEQFARSDNSSTQGPESAKGPGPSCG